jgi:hypothetical protein
MTLTLAQLADEATDFRGVVLETNYEPIPSQDRLWAW